MTSRSKGYSHSNDWDPMREDFDNTTYDPQYPDDDSSGGVNLDHCRLYIKNIPIGLNKDGLMAAFSKFGKLVESFMSTDPNKRYGLIAFETPGEAKIAMMKLNKTGPLNLTISVAHKSKPRDNQQRDNRNNYRQRSGKEYSNSSSGYNRERTSYRDDESVSSREKQSHAWKQDEPNNKVGVVMDNRSEDEMDLESLDPDLNEQIDQLWLEELNIKEKKLQITRKMLLNEAEKKRSSNQMVGVNRSIMPDGRIVVRNIEKSQDKDAAFGAGGGDSNNRDVCQCQNNRGWELLTSEDSSAPSTCVLCLGDRSPTCPHKREKNKSDTASKYTVSKKSDVSKIESKITDISRKSNATKTTYTTRKSDATSKKKFELVNKPRSKSEMAYEFKYSDFCSDSEEGADETNRLIHLRNNDYCGVVEESLKIVVALAGYPISKMRLRQIEQFKKALTDVIEMQSTAGLMHKVPSFLDYYLSRGAMVCICKDLCTRDWMIRISPGLQERMNTNLIMMKTKVKRLCSAVLKLPKSCWPATAKDVFKLLQYFNPALRTDMWRIYSQKTVDDIECTSFILDKVSSEIIRGPSFKNVIDYSQMEFELTGYSEIYYDSLLSDSGEDLTSVASRVKLLEEIKSAEQTPKIQSVVNVQSEEVVEPELNETVENRNVISSDVIKKEIMSDMQISILKKLKGIKYMGDKDEIIMWSDETHNYTSDREKGDDRQSVGNIESTSDIGLSERSESFIESDNIIGRNSNLNIDSNRGIAYHRRTNYLHVEDELKVAITLEGYPQNKLEGTHIRRLKHLFKEYLHKDLKLQRFTNLIIPKFQDVYLSNGAVIYICDSLETKDYLVEVMPKFINSTGLKLMFRSMNNLVRYTRIVIRLSKDHANVESVQILRDLQTRYPGLRLDCWKFYSDVAGKQKRQFGVDPQSLNVIKSADFNPTYEGEQIIFRVIDRQKKDVSFTESIKDSLVSENMEYQKLKDIAKNMYVPLEPEIMNAPLTNIRTNHYSKFIADDFKLYVGPSDYPESKVDELFFRSIKQTLEVCVCEAVNNESATEESIPKIHDMYLFDGVIFIICQDFESRLLIEQFINNVNYKLHTSLKCTEFRGAVGIVSMIATTEKDPQEVITILQQQNPRLRTKYWRKISTIQTKTKLDTVLQIDKLSAQVITGEGFNKYVGSSPVEFKLTSNWATYLLNPKDSLKKLKKRTRKSKSNTKLSSHENADNENKEVMKAEVKAPTLKIEEWDSIAQQFITNTELPATATIENEAMSNKENVLLGSETEKSDLDPVIIQNESPRLIKNDLSVPTENQTCKMILKIPVTILPENKEDLSIIFDLLEDKNPGLNVELWTVTNLSDYPNNGRFRVQVDVQSAAVIKGKQFDSTVGGETLKFYY